MLPPAFHTSAAPAVTSGTVLSTINTKVLLDWYEHQKWKIISFSAPFDGEGSTAIAIRTKIKTSKVSLVPEV